MPQRIPRSQSFDGIADKNKQPGLQAVQVQVFYIKVHSAGSQTQTYTHSIKRTAITSNQ